MKSLICTSCGASEFIKRDGYQECAYCGVKYKLEISTKGTFMTDEISTLLQKCKLEPHNARKYANLILDIDPGNKEAMRYL